VLDEPPAACREVLAENEVAPAGDVDDEVVERSSSGTTRSTEIKRRKSEAAGCCSRSSWLASSSISG
jgi:hypothetical protein